MKKKILITGLGVVSPIGIGKNAFWESLAKGVSGVGPIQRFDSTDFPCRIAAEIKDFEEKKYFTPKIGRRMDLVAKYSLAAAQLAVQDAVINVESLDRTRVGVVVGASMGGISSFEEQHVRMINKGPSSVSPLAAPKIMPNSPASEIAIQFGFEGLNFGMSSACSTASHSIGTALRYLQCGDADMILAGGGEAGICRTGMVGFSQCRAMTRDFNDHPTQGSRPFDAKRSGFVMGEGAGVLVLETEESSRARGATIYAELAGYGATHDAFHITAPHPKAGPIKKSIQLALNDAIIKPEEVDYINAHGTSTPLNDRMETLAIKEFYGSKAYQIPISSTKSMTGHLLGGAGAVELIATLLCMKNKRVHPTLNLEVSDPECDLDYVPNTARAHKINVAVSHSFGFGGHNAVLVVKNIH